MPFVGFLCHPLEGVLVLPTVGLLPLKFKLMLPLDSLLYSQTEKHCWAQNNSSINTRPRKTVAAWACPPVHTSQLGLTHTQLLGLCSLAGDVRPSLMSVLITVEVNARLACSHPVSPAPCFPSTQTSAV